MSNSLAISGNGDTGAPRVGGVLATIALVVAFAVGAFGLVYTANLPLRSNGFALAAPAAAAADPIPIAGAFTGTYENDLPVYRLPPVQITARRAAH
jgi:hypothetical protein